MYTFLIADPRRFVRMGLSAMFSNLDNIKHVLEATSIEEVLKYREKVPINLALIHQSLITSQALFHQITIPVVVFTSEPNLNMLYMIYQNHGRGYITENAPFEILSMLLSQQEETFLLDPAIAFQLLDVIASQPLPCQIANLTEREKEIFDLLCKGYTNNEISQELYISLTTVKKHVANISQKLDMKRRSMKIFARVSEREI